MPRPLIYGNGNLFLGVDDRLRIRDFFYPQVGQQNHLSGHAIRTGIWIEGAFAWLDEEGWNRELAYEPGTLTGHVTLDHPAFGIELTVTDSCSPGLPIFVRTFSLKHRHPGNRETRLFVSHDLRISESDIGDTAFFAPSLEGVVHYKGPVWILFGGNGSTGGLHEYATGIKGFGGLEGTWRDAEDGRLGMNPIAQGSVDSTISFSLGDGPSAEAHWWALCGKSLEELESLFDAFAGGGPAGIHNGCRESSGALASRVHERLAGLPEEVVHLCETSLLVVRSHCDRGGAILAALDSDIMATNRANYAYCWPRDGAHIATVLDRFGLHEAPKRFFRFCAGLVSARHPLLLQKYRADGTLGATWHPWIVDGRPELPLQEDESASVLHALGEHFLLTGDEALVEELYQCFIVPTADALLDFRDSVSGLPRSSYDLWEERRGAHAYTAAAVVAGLRAAGALGAARGDVESRRYIEAAEDVSRAIGKHLYSVQDGCFVRSLRPDVQPDPVPDASMLHLALMGALDPHDTRFQATCNWLERELRCGSSVGGFARYLGDYYFRSGDGPGNPWIITTMWFAQVWTAQAKEAAELQRPIELLRWAAAHGGSTGILPEQLHPETGAHLSVSPLAWSHAEVLKTALDIVEKRAELERSL
jgi:GH15 family glucan-1,4-alpha-glucosidase